MIAYFFSKSKSIIPDFSALKIYREKHGHVDVPCRFKVPQSEDWPENLWDLKLGYRVHNIRYRGDFVKEHPEYHQLLDELGFIWKGARRRKNYSSPVGDVVVVDGQLFHFQ